jgi:asparagine synthase (glutamine-hydrolysing)
MSTSSFSSDAAPWLASLSEASLCLSGRGVDALKATSPDGSLTAVFDGIIYNRNELSVRLADVLPTASDPELVLQAYRSWGADLLRRVKGIFALIIWDGTRDVLFGARDPLGVYPLFYAEGGSEVLLSTSVETLVHHPRVSSVVSRIALARHVCHDWLRPDETYFSGVKRVPSGHAMRIARGERRVYRYWDPAPPDRPMRWIREDELEQFDSLLEQAVDRCLGFGPAVIHLSGGLDSPTIARVTADRSRVKGQACPSALSIVHPATNEEAIQKRVASDLGLSQALLSFEEIAGPQGMLASALDLSKRWPWPLSNPGTVLFYNMCIEDKRQGGQVILTGTGGDEWLAFSSFYSADLLRALDFANLFRLLGAARRCYPISRRATARNLLWRYGLRLLLAAALHRVAPSGLRAYRRRRRPRWIPDWLAPDPSLRRELHQWLDGNGEPTGQERQPKAFYLRSLRRQLEVDFEDDFEVGRRLGVRVMHPFWDADLVEFLYRIPPTLLNRDGYTKGLVRHALAQRFPDLGFAQQRKLVPATLYDDVVLNEGWAAWQRMGGVSSLGELGLVDVSGLSANVVAIFFGRQPKQFPRVWDVLSLEAWLRGRLR